MAISMNEKVDRYNRYFSIVRFIVAVFIAFFISFVIMAFSTNHPLKALMNLFIGPFTTLRRFSTVLETAIPLTFAGLSVCVMFKAKQFNLASEGSFFLGALASALVAIYLPLPPVFSIIVALIIAGIIGALICGIPGICKVKWNSSELVLSLMLNYVALYVGTFIFNQVAKDPSSA